MRISILATLLFACTGRPVSRQAWVDGAREWAVTEAYPQKRFSHIDNVERVQDTETIASAYVQTFFTDGTSVVLACSKDGDAPATCLVAWDACFHAN